MYDPRNPRVYRKMITELGEEYGKSPAEIEKDIKEYEKSRMTSDSKRDQGYGKIK